MFQPETAGSREKNHAPEPQPLPPAAASKIIDRARELLGLPWVHQGRNPALGLDCAGLAIEVLKSVGVDIDAPINYSRAANQDAMQAVIDRYCFAVKYMQPGDFLFMRFRHIPRHVGIVVNKKFMIHSYEGKGVVMQELSPFWLNRIVCVYRIKPEFIAK